MRSLKKKQYIKYFCFSSVSSTVLYIYYEVITCWGDPSPLSWVSVCTMPLAPSSISLVSKVISVGDSQIRILRPELSLWNPKFLYPVVYLTSPFGYMIGIIIITLKNRNIEFFLHAFDFFFFFFTFSFSHVSKWYHPCPWHFPRIFFLLVSLSLSQQVPVVPSSKSILCLSTSLCLPYCYPRSTYTDLFFGKLDGMACDFEKLESISCPP